MGFGFTRQVVAPYAEPIHLDEAKNHLRQEGIDADDALIGRMIHSARRWCETLTGLQLVAAQWMVALPAFGWAIEMPHAPVLTVDSVTYLDLDGVRRTVATSEYQSDLIGYPHTVYPVWTHIWPAQRVWPNSVQVSYTSGFICPFTAASDVLTVRGRTFAENELVRLSNSGGDLPGGLFTDTDYFAVGVDNNAGEVGLATEESGSAITTTDAGTGTSFIGVLPGTLLDAMLLKVCERYEGRGDSPFAERLSASDCLLMSEWTGTV